MSDRLCVIMPVYNEEAAIGGVLQKWDYALGQLGIDYIIRPYNDGSKDASLRVMTDFARNHPRVEVRDKKNGGHGHTILTGYQEAAHDGFDWIFQIDSDDEMGPEMFDDLWSRRGAYDFLVGIRDGRIQALPRKIVSFVSRLCVKVFYGKSVWDVNSPYRLMRVSAFKDLYGAIPLTTFAPNVILSGLATRYRMRCFETKVPQHDRTTGEVSIKKWKLLKAAMRSFRQTVTFALTSARGKDWLRLFLWGLGWCFVALSLAVGVKNGFREFDFQWDPAKLLAMGDNPYRYSLENKPVPYEGFMQKYIVANQVPSCLLLLLPFTFLPQLLANQVWDVCNLIFTAVFLIYLYKSFFEGRPDANKFVWVALLFLSGTPLREIIGNGQHLLFSLAFFMPAYYYATKERWYVSGILLALSAFKYTTIAPLAFVFVFRRWWRPLLMAAVLHVVATIGCGLYLHESPLVLVLQSLKVGAGLTAQGSCDLASLMYQIGCENTAVWANFGYVAFGVLLLVLSFMKRRDDLLALSLLGVISNVMFYHRNYDFVVLVFPIAYALLTKDSGSFALKALKWVLGVVVFWTFYGVRILHQADIHPIVVDFVLMHALLVALLVCFGKRMTATNQTLEEKS